MGCCRVAPCRPALLNRLSPATLHLVARWMLVPGPPIECRVQKRRGTDLVKRGLFQNLTNYRRGQPEIDLHPSCGRVINFRAVNQRLRLPPVEPFGPWLFVQKLLDHEKIHAAQCPKLQIRDGPGVRDQRRGGARGDEVGTVGDMRARRVSQANLIFFPFSPSVLDI